MNQIDTTQQTSVWMKPKWLGVAALLALILHVLVEKIPQGITLELFWICHLATFLLVLGLFVGSPVLTAVGFLSHVAYGAPAFLLDVIFVKPNSWTSWITHIVSPVASGIAVYHWGIPKKAPLQSWFFLIGSLLASYLFTPPAMNINMAHAVWKPFARFFPNIYSYLVFNSLVGVLFITAVILILKKVFKWKTLPASTQKHSTES